DFGGTARLEMRFISSRQAGSGSGNWLACRRCDASLASWPPVFQSRWLAVCGFVGHGRPPVNGNKIARQRFVAEQSQNTALLWFQDFCPSVRRILRKTLTHQWTAAHLHALRQ